MNPIISDKNNAIATIRLNRPKAYNSINASMAILFQEQLRKFADDDDIKVIIITGEGNAFCAGQDIVEITTPSLHPGFKNILEKHYAPIVRLIREIEKPVIAAVNGVAAGAGANIALACDIIIATEKSSFIQAFSAIGLIPDSAGTYFLPRLIGFQKALALAMLGDKVSAKEADAMGMIYKYCEDEKFNDVVYATANKLASLPARGLALTKQAFNASLTNNLEQQLALENKLQIEASQTEDYQEGVTAFVEKRKPKFKGR